MPISRRKKLGGSSLPSFPCRAGTKQIEIETKTRMVKQLKIGSMSCLWMISNET
jgi:hypothetical protein